MMGVPREVRGGFLGAFRRLEGELVCVFVMHAMMLVSAGRWAMIMPSTTPTLGLEFMLLKSFLFFFDKSITFDADLY
jgi:hypothetical protein